MSKPAAEAAQQLFTVAQYGPFFGICLGQTARDQNLQWCVQKHHTRVFKTRKQLASGFSFYRATAQGNYYPFPPAAIANHFRLNCSKSRLAILSKNLRHLLAGTGLNYVVGIHKIPIEMFRQQRSNRGLPRPHEASEHNAPY